MSIQHEKLVINCYKYETTTIFVCLILRICILNIVLTISMIGLVFLICRPPLYFRNRTTFFIAGQFFSFHDVLNLSASKTFVINIFVHYKLCSYFWLKAIVWANWKAWIGFWKLTSALSSLRRINACTYTYTYISTSI